MSSTCEKYLVSKNHIQFLYNSTHELSTNKLRYEELKADGGNSFPYSKAWVADSLIAQMTCPNNGFNCNSVFVFGNFVEDLIYICCENCYSMIKDNIFSMFDFAFVNILHIHSNTTHTHCMNCRQVCFSKSMCNMDKIELKLKNGLFFNNRIS